MVNNAQKLKVVF